MGLADRIRSLVTPTADATTADGATYRRSRPKRSVNHRSADARAEWEAESNEVASAIGTKSYSDGVRQVLLPAVLDYQSAVRTYYLFKEHAEEMIGLAAGAAAIAKFGAAGDAALRTHRRLSIALTSLAARSEDVDLAELDAFQKGVRRSFDPGNICVFLRASGVSGQVFLLGDEVFVRGTAIARLGYLSTEADELVLKTQHLGEQELIAGISLRDAADLKTDFEDMGFPVRLKEGAVPRTAARRDAIPKTFGTKSGVVTAVSAWTAVLGSVSSSTTSFRSAKAARIRLETSSFDVRTAIERRQLGYKVERRWS